MLKPFSQLNKPAEILYLDADIRIVQPGDYVLCAVTGHKIPLEALCYWSVDRQEAYKDASAALMAERAHQKDVDHSLKPQSGTL